MKRFISTMILGCAVLAMPAQTNGETPNESTQQETLGTGRLAEIQIHGKKLAKFNKDKFEYVHNVYYQEQNDFAQGCITVKNLPGDSSTVIVSYNPGTRIAEVKSFAVVGDSVKTYKIKFSRLFHQLEDAGFEKYLSGKEPLYGWHSFASATGAANFAKDLSPQPQSVEGGANGSKRAVMITSKNVLGFANANGNLTTGAINMGAIIATDPANHNFTAADSISHSLSFQGKPDSVVFYTKFKAGELNLGGCANANFILHKDGKYRDPEVESMKNLRIAKASDFIVQSDSWKRNSIPFVYDEGVKGGPKYLLASITTNPIPGESSGDTLYFDEVKFIYNHTLSSLTLKGAEFNFKEDSLNYDLRGSHYSINDVAYTTTGVGAFVQKKFDAATGLYTFTVKGNDFNTNKESVTVYTLQLDTPDTVSVNGIKIFGESLADFDMKKNQYLVMGKDYEEGCISVDVANQEHTGVEIAYNPATRCANINLTALKGGASVSYRVKFEKGFYQFEDAGFENYTEGLEPLYGWHSFASATGVMAAFGKALSPNPVSVEDGANGSKRSVMLYSKNVILANANGNLTTGIINMGSYIPTDASNHNFTSLDSLNNHFLFAGRPDSVVFYAKFKAGELNSAKVGRANFILHDKVQYKDPEDSTQLSNRIGKASQLISESKDWTKYVAPFEYEKEQPEVQYLLASVTTNPIPGESAGDTLYFDEVKFVYNHALSALAYEGATLEFNENTLNYELLDADYSRKNLSYTVNGAGAVVEEEFNSTNNTLTLTVKGNDYAVNEESMTQYTIKFGSATGIEGLENANGNVNVYDLNGRALRVNVKAATALEGLPAGVYIVNGKKVVK